MSNSENSQDTFYEDVRVLDPYGDPILTDGTGNSNNKGIYFFELFKIFPVSGKRYIITAINLSTKLPVRMTLSCIKGSSTSSFR